MIILSFYSMMLSLFGLGNFSPQIPIDTTELRNEILAQFAKQPDGNFAVAVKDISAGQEFLMNAHESFHAASTMKTALLIETFKQASEHRFSLSDSIVIHNDFKSIVDGSIYSMDSANDGEKDLYEKIGSKLPIENVLYRMITKSSNFSTNLIVELIGAKNANNTMHALGAKDIQVLRGVEDAKAFEHGMNNTTTAYDLMVMFEHIAKGTVVNKNACKEMIRILMDQYYRDIIPAKLPPGIKTATKSGSIEKVCHDSGIVFLPDGRKYVVVLLSRGIADQNVSTDILATVSRIIYNHETKTNP
ncbi:MAG TPA: serine hydrolase [Hanamia sp.]|nr:serine hydrolase [Hanamia sp.]